MADENDNGGLRLRVDRLAAAMDAARARARAGGDGVASSDPVAESRDTPSAGATRAAPPAAEVASKTAQPVADTAPIPPAGPAPRAPLSAEGPVRADAPAVGGPDQNDSARLLRTEKPSAPSRRVRNDDAAPVTPATDVPPDGSRPLLLTPDFYSPDPGPDPAVDPAVIRGVDMAPGDPPTIVVPATPAPAAPVPDPSAAAALLALSGVATDIGRYRILEDVTLDVPRGAVTMLLGRNGAGKTTTLRTIMGLWRARAGEIVFAGERIDRWATHRIARVGIGYVPESMSIFGDLTVAENITLGARKGPAARDRLDWLMGLFPPLGTFWRAPAGNLSGGQKQMLALARALVEKRRLYLIDEPTKGLAPVIVDTVVAALRDLKLQGATILMVEQNFAVARALGDGCAVIDDGRVSWTGTMAALADDPALQARLMGLDLGDAA